MHFCSSILGFIIFAMGGEKGHQETFAHLHQYMAGD